MSKLFSLEHIRKSFNTMQGEINAIDDVSFDVNDGEFISLLGTSGCGKSTLLSIISGLENKSDGDIIWNKEDLVIGYMLQEDALLPYYSVLDNVLLGLKIQKSLNDESKDYVIKLLKKYDLYKFKDKYPHELSGGMKQRVA